MALPKAEEVRLPSTAARPFLKWAGGKTQLLSQYGEFFPSSRCVRRYHEPFLGSAAVYLHLYNRKWIAPEQARLRDLNPSLICAWRWIKDGPQEVADHLRRLEDAYDPANPDTYYVNRERFNALRTVDSAEVAALLITLNRTCFNGLYRVNSQGAFNVPVGRYVNPRILHEENLWAVSEALQGTQLSTHTFQHTLRATKPGDFVYFDPPYEPLSRTSQFRSYSKDGFSQDDQRHLAALFERLTRRKVMCMLSNSTAPLIEELYGDLADRYGQIEIHRVKARRSISAQAKSRAPIEEIVVTNY